MSLAAMLLPPRRQFFLTLIAIGTLCAGTLLADTHVASARAAQVCEAFTPGLDADGVNTLINDAPARSGFLRMRGEPGRMYIAPAGGRRAEFLQFAVVFRGFMLQTRQCVVSIKGGRVERSQVMHPDAWVMLTPVQTVRIR